MIMKQYYLTIVIVNIALVSAGWTLFENSVSAQGQTSASGLDPDIAEMLSTNPPPLGFATRLDYIKSFTNGVDLEKAYRAERISKEEAMVAMMINKLSPADNSEMDVYGKVVDQNGEPVVGAKVRGFLEFEEKDIDEEHDTKTDVQGRFLFLGLHAKGLAMVPGKEGYEFNANILSNVNRPSNYLPDPNNPLIITMWKLHEPEPMTHSDRESSVPRDGTARKFSLLTGRKDISGGLTVQLFREPLEIATKDLRKPFNWSFTLAITNGGLLGYTNQPYPYEAPSEGYQKVITMNFPTNMTGWQSWFKHDYYFNDQNGQIYGRMTIEVHAGAPTPEAYFKITDYVNAAGSRNLEFDAGKQIKK